VALGVETARRFGPYVLIEPYSKHTNLRWPFDRWQELVEARSDLTFVQHVHAQSPVLEGVQTVPATFRQACGLVAASRLYVRSESGMCHATAALRKPMVTVWGACMDWDVLGGYPNQIGIVSGAPCGQYLPCPHCTDAMEDISVDEVSAAISTSLFLQAGVH
jgi:ADP-heptose:LPS heptosyltransferase